MATIYDVRTSSFINVLTLFEQLTITGGFHASFFEVSPFTIPVSYGMVVFCFVMRWFTTVWLFASVVKALHKRKIIHVSMLFRPDTY